MALDLGPKRSKSLEPEISHYISPSYLKKFIRTKHGYNYRKTCYLRSLLWTATCFVRPLCKIYLLYNSLDFKSLEPEISHYISPSYLKKFIRTKHGYNYRKTCYLRSLLWTATCFVRPLCKIYLLYNSLDLMFILPLLCEGTCLLRPIFVENFGGLSKQVLLYMWLPIECHHASGDGHVHGNLHRRTSQYSTLI